MYLKLNKMNRIITHLLIAVTIFFACESGSKKTDVNSPNGQISVKIFEEDGQLMYSVAENGTPLINASKLGLRFKEHSPLGEKVKIISTENRSFNETWEQPWGEKRLIENRYEELAVKVKELGDEGKEMTLRMRVFNDGLGFRYEIPAQNGLDSITIMDEITQFALPTLDKAWWIPAYSENYYESVYRYTPINQIDTICLPMTIETIGGKYLAIHEANLTDYAAMNLYCEGESTLRCDLAPWSTGEKVFTKAPFVSPWRTVLIANQPGDLITSYLILNLNEPCAINDISWIEPQRYVGIWWGMHMEKYTWHMGPKHGATTENTKKYIDFAAKHGFGGVLVEGWNYGWEYNWTTEGHKFNFTTPYPDFDINEITEYGHSKGVRLIGHHETGGATKNYEEQMEEAFAMYQRLGIRSVKTGYVSNRLDGVERHSSQYGVRHNRKVIETAAKYQIMVNIHEPVVQTGLRRTYPNLMAQEGVRGQEYNAWSADGGNKPDHLTIIPFTRGLAGPIDFTPGIFNFKNTAYPNTRVQTTLAKQLALYVTIYSPLQMAADLPENYEGHPALKFIENVPVNWDVTKVLDAKIGDYLTIVRKDRNSNEWFLGSITDENSLVKSFNLDFLDPNLTYTAQIYRDGEDADWASNPTSISIEEMEVRSTDRLHFRLATSGGVAIRFVPY
jgi:alpha-glucosidase